MTSEVVYYQMKDDDEEFIQVMEKQDGDGVMEFPKEGDGNLLLRTIQIHFAAAIGLKYKGPSGAWRFVKEGEDANLLAPKAGWGNRIYYLTFPKKEDNSRKRKGEETITFPRKEDNSRKKKGEETTTVPTMEDNSQKEKGCDTCFPGNTNSVLRKVDDPPPEKLSWRSSQPTNGVNLITSPSSNLSPRDIRLPDGSDPSLNWRNVQPDDSCIDSSASLSWRTHLNDPITNPALSWRTAVVPRSPLVAPAEGVEPSQLSWRLRDRKADDVGASELSWCATNPSHSNSEPRSLSWRDNQPNGREACMTKPLY